MSSFKDLQENVCYKPPEEVVDVDIKVCPDCIPKPELPEVTDWESNFTPYFSERDCEYHCTVIVNIQGNIYYAKSSADDGMPTLEGQDLSPSQQNEILDLAGQGIDPLNLSGTGVNSGARELQAVDDFPFSFDSLLKSYIRPAIRKTLRHYNKLETDEIVCAAPPESPGQVCAGIFGLEYEKFIETTEIPTGEPIPNYFEQLSVNPAISDVDAWPIKITNYEALELFARVKNFKFVTNKKVLYVQVSIPSYKFNQVPDAPPLGSLETGTEKVVLNTRQFMSQIGRFKSAMNTFAGYQAYFYRQENGRIYFEETEEPFYIKFYSEDDGRIDRFIDQLSILMSNNGFNIKRYDFENFTKDYPGEIEITFDKRDPNKPFKILNVRARKVGGTSGFTENLLSQSTTEPVPVRSINCPFVDCGIGLTEFIKYSENNQTMMGYISAINGILSELESNVTPPWLDFIVNRTYPQLSINYGSTQIMEDNSCLSVNLDGLQDFIHQAVFDAFDAFSYAWNQNRCKTVEDIERLEWNRFKEAWNEIKSSGEATELSDAYKERIQNPAKNIKKTTSKNIVFDPSFVSSMPKNFLSGAGKVLVNLLNPCEIERMLSGALVCLGAALTLDELYYSLFKQALDTVGAEAVRIVMNTLPANKAQKIQEVIDEEFKNMPYPWEEGWEGGSLQNAIDRNVMDAKAKVKTTDDDYKNLEELKSIVEFLKEFVKSGRDVNYETAVALAATMMLPRDSSGELLSGSVVSTQENMVQLAGAEFFSPIQSTSDKFDELKVEYYEYIKNNGGTEWLSIVSMVDDLLDIKENALAFLQEITLRESYIAEAKTDENVPLEIFETIKQRVDAGKILINSSNSQLMTEDLSRMASQLGYNPSINFRLQGNLLYVDTPTETLKAQLSDYEESYKINFRNGTVKLTNRKKDELKRLTKEYENRVKEATKFNKDYKKKFSKEVTESTQYKNWDQLPQEQKMEMAAEQERNKFFVKTKPSDEITPGTFGKALGNIQQVLVSAYIEEIMNSVTVAEMQKIYEKIPGANFIAKLIPQFVCPTEEELIYPKIDNFLSTLTFDPCNDADTKLSLPSLQDVSTSFNWLEMLGDAFFEALKKLISSVLMALMQKVAEILQSSLDFCDLAGNLTQRLIENADDLGNGFNAFIDDVLCSDPKSEDSRERVYRNLEKKAIGTQGGPNISNAAQRSSTGLMQTISALSTQREVKAAMVGRSDPRYLSNISNIVKELNPEYEQFFSDPTKTEQFFRSMGNFLTPQQRSSIIEELENPVTRNQPDVSICLTNEERAAWDLARERAFADPELGRKFVDNENEKLNNAVADAAKLLMSGPGLEEAIAEAFAPKDPDCKVNKGLIPTKKDYPENVQETISNSITGIFKRLEKAFIDDTIEANFFSSFFGFNTPGILSLILANNKNDTLNYHMVVTKNPILNFIFNNGVMGGKMELPETVGYQMFDYIQNVLEVQFIENRSVVLNYNNGREDNEKFNSKISLSDSITALRTYTISDKSVESFFVSSQDLLYDSGYEIASYEQAFLENPDSEPASASSRSLLKMFDSIFSGVVNYSYENISDDLVGMNNIVYNNLSKSLFYRRSGQISEGFLFGNQDEPIVEEEDLAYVDPEPGATEYTHSEEEKVLGRSLTNNPRVHFLDPAQYGGTYLAPNIYISEATHKGWLGFMKIITPNPTGCDPKNSNFLFLDRLIKLIEDKENKISPHELLEFSPECTFELPFDKIANSNTLATLEGIVRATCRVHISDFIIRTFPVHSNVHLDMNLNFNNIVLEYLCEKIKESLINERSVFASTYEGMTYYLLFLEQVAQVVKREVESGNIENNPELEEIFNIIKEAQIAHKDECFITPKNLKFVKNPDDFPSLNINAPNVGSVELNNVEGSRSKFVKMRERMELGIATIGENSGFDLLSSISNFQFGNHFGLSLTRARFASKIYRIDSIKQHVQKLLKYVVKQEFEMYRQELLEKQDPRPYIYDISKYFIGGSNILLGKTTDSGTYDTEFPIGGGIGNFPFGDVNDCADENLQHPLTGQDIQFDKYTEVTKFGGFYLEKYVVCKEKEGVFNNLPDKFKGVLQIKELKDFLRNKVSIGEIGGEEFVSDYFGDAELLEDGSDFIGEIGVKFGVRLCYIPPTNKNFEQNEETKRLRSFRLNRPEFNVYSEEGQLIGQPFPLVSSISIPIASFEQDIPDVTIFEILDSDDLMDQDLKCYIDKLVKTNNFRHLMENVLDIKKVPSLFMIYSYRNFLLSLGVHEDERLPSEDEEPPIASSKVDKLFNDCRAEARRMFAAYYKNNDRDPPNEEENNEDFVQNFQRSILNDLSFINLGDFSFDIRRRLKTENPFDKDGKPCKNTFSKLYKLKRQD